MEEQIKTIKEEFHSLNNWLSKITIRSGQARYELEKKKFDLENLEEEKDKMIKLLADLEECALKIGEVLKKLRKIYSSSKEC